jgi:hypothetical protein
MKKAFVALLVVTAILAGGEFVEAAESDPVVSVEIRQDVASVVHRSVAGYDLLSVPDCGYLAEPGKPMMPAVELKIALPDGMSAKRVRLEAIMLEQIDGKFDILPAQPPLTTSADPSASLAVPPDSAVYGSSTQYPSESVVLQGQGDLAGQGIAFVTFHPLVYIPSEGTVRLIASARLVLEGEYGYVCGDYLPSESSASRYGDYKAMIEGVVENPSDVVLVRSHMTAKQRSLTGGPFDHVAITTSTLVSAYQPLVDWHNKRGVRDTIVDRDWIYANYSGASNQEKIRNFVIDAYSSWAITYVLIGGESSQIPFETRLYSDEQAPSDHYYSDFDDDWMIEVQVGRSTASSASEVSTFVNKVLLYEKDPPRSSYAMNALLIGMDLDDYTPCENLKETIDGYIPPTFNVTKVYDSHSGDHRTAVINALNAGQNLVNHADHSYITVMGTGDFHHGWSISNSTVDGLTNNNRLSVIFSNGCHPNHMDSEDCIAERFVTHNAGQAAVAFVGNTRSGFYFQGDPYSLTNKLDQQLWRSLMTRDRYIIGQALQEACHNTSHSSSIEKQCEWTINLLGEPSMPLWTADPVALDVECPSEIVAGLSTLQVTVTDSATQQPVDEATVCLLKQGEVYSVGTTDASGRHLFEVEPSSEGVLFVTATKHNYIPFEQQIAVSDAMCGDADRSGMVDIDDVVYLIQFIFASGPPPDPLSSGDVDCSGDIDIDDAVYLITYVFAGGPSPCPTC